MCNRGTTYNRYIAPGSAQFSKNKNEVKSGQQRKSESSIKLHRSLSTILRYRISRQVMNLLDSEIKLLGRSLSFNLNPELLKPIDVMPVIEDKINLLTPEVVNKAGLQIESVIKSRRSHVGKLLFEEQAALKAHLYEKSSQKLTDRI
ncbi:hypothetical protein T265_07449 [Opisthorchis viverrini]|uniref:Uncharacterized protein n=1 Tax=Opisthorchis viverrini TaxID=6198 RepID=A0A074ZCH8_OPIVI|nr:hypothetical protein T265_07449 [Opisthorchis viverrini]KER24996.1 hypothetical protein T265_07449 [Opisthorchis viverrini]